MTATISKLSLVAFAVTNEDPPHIVFTLKGSAKSLPSGIPTEKGPKGTRIAKISERDIEALYELAAVIDIASAPEVAEVDGPYWGWYHEHFLLTVAGDEPEADAPAADPEPEEVIPPEPEEIPPEPEPVKPTKAKKAAKAGKKAPEPAPEPEPTPEPPAPEPVVDPITARRAELNAMKAEEVAEYLLSLGAGARPRTKREGIDQILAIENFLAEVMKTSATVTAAISTATLPELRVMLVAERAGRQRKSVLAALEGAVAAAEAEAEQTRAFAAAQAAKRAEERAAAEAAKQAEAEAKAARAAERAAAKAAKEAQSGTDEERRARAIAILQTIATPLQQLADAMGPIRAARAARTVMTTPLADIDYVALVGTHARARPVRRDGEGRTLIGFQPGLEHTVTKHHRDDRGPSTYTVRCEEGGGYTLTAMRSARTDVRVGQRFSNGMELIKALTRREKGIPSVADWFGLNK